MPASRDREGGNRAVDPRWRRLEGVVDVSVLSERHAIVVGLGSGGSTVALELSKAGVGLFTLVDPDRLKEQNLVRHECDDRYLGWNKAEAVADLIGHRNPRAEIAIVPSDVFAIRDPERLIGSSDLVAVCTDVEPPKHLVNRLCTSAGATAVYAGVYERGVGGEVILCEGGQEDACFACVSSVMKESVPVVTKEELDYGMIGPDGTLPASSGLGLDVRFIALVQAKVCLETLRRGDHTGMLDANVVLFGMTAVDGLFPRALSSALVRVSRQDGCLVCTRIRGEYRRRAV